MKSKLWFTRIKYSYFAYITVFCLLPLCISAEEYCSVESIGGLTVDAYIDPSRRFIYFNFNNYEDRSKRCHWVQVKAKYADLLPNGTMQNIGSRTVVLNNLLVEPKTLYYQREAGIDQIVDIEQIYDNPVIYDVDYVDYFCEVEQVQLDPNFEARDDRHYDMWSDCRDISTVSVNVLENDRGSNIRIESARALTPGTSVSINGAHLDIRINGKCIGEFKYTITNGNQSDSANVLVDIASD